jgi:hypothetical protein
MPKITPTLQFEELTLSNVSVIITDLDNTLFDWVEIWYHSFSALVDRIEKDSNIQREQLLDEIREVHQRRNVGIRFSDRGDSFTAIYASEC